MTKIRPLLLSREQGGDNLLLNPLDFVTTILSDVQVWGQIVSYAQKEALKFTQYAVHELEQQGIDTNNIFVTGHSLGGIEASYVAQQTGLAGIAFESTGIPSSANAHDGNNFLNVVTYNDIVGEYASDTLSNTAFVTGFSEGEKGTFNHYGHIVKVGDPADEAPLINFANGWNNGEIKNLVSIVNQALHSLPYHLPMSQAKDMGVTLSPRSYLYDALYQAHGPVVPIGQDTIGQYLTENSHSMIAAVHNG